MSCHDIVLQLDGNEDLESNKPEECLSSIIPEHKSVFTEVTQHDGSVIWMLPYPCDQCDNQFSHENDLKDHKAKKHNPNKLTSKRTKKRPKNNM